MKSLDTVKIGDKVVLRLVDKMVFDYLAFGVAHGTDINKLRILCQLEKDVKYEVTDVCKTCKSLRIKVGEHFVSINVMTCKKSWRIKSNKTQLYDKTY